MRLVSTNAGESLDDVVARLLPARSAAERARLRDTLLHANPQIAKATRRLDATVLVIPDAAGQPKPAAGASATPTATLGDFLRKMRADAGDLERPLAALLDRTDSETEAQQKLLASPEVKAAARKEPHVAAAVKTASKTTQADAAQHKATRELLQGALKQFDEDLGAMLKRLG